MCATSLGLHACKHTTQHYALGFVSLLLFQNSTSKCPKSSQISVPDGYTFHRLMYCNVRALGTRTNRAIVTITIKKSTKLFHPEAVFSPGFIY